MMNTTRTAKARSLRSARLSSPKSAVRTVIEQLEQRTLLSATLQNGLLSIVGTTGPDTITISRNKQDPSLLNVNVNGAISKFSANQIAAIEADGLAGADNIQVSELKGAIATPVTFRGGSGADTLVGGSGNDVMHGGRGSDLIMGMNGNDWVNGGLGNDRLLGENGNDTIAGGGGSDDINGGAGNDSTFGESSTSSVDSGGAFARHPLLIHGNVPAGYNPDFFNFGISGYTVAQMRNAYNFQSLSDPANTNLGQGQTIAIVDAFHNPNLLPDLNVFSQVMGIEIPTPGQVQLVEASGKPSVVNGGWSGEEALDVEWAHAIAPLAKIIVVEADSNLDFDLEPAVAMAADLVAQNGGGTLSMSFGATEQADIADPFNNAYRSVIANHPTVTFVAASGDDGQELNSPGSPAIFGGVLSVGGTFLALDNNGNLVTQEIAWADSGGGLSSAESAPGYQLGMTATTDVGAAAAGVTSNTSPGIFNGTVIAPPLPTAIPGFPPPFFWGRIVPDVAYNADPASGVAVFDSTPSDGFAGWQPIGGTSAGSPQWAALIALANQQRVQRGLPVLGSNAIGAIYDTARSASSQDFTDITAAEPPAGAPIVTGPAVPGFDSTTGWGSPNASPLISDLANFGGSVVNDQITFKGNFFSPSLTDTSGNILFQNEPIGGIANVNGENLLDVTGITFVQQPFSTLIATGPTGFQMSISDLFRRSDGSIFGFGTITSVPITVTENNTTGTTNVTILPTTENIKITGGSSVGADGKVHISGNIQTIDALGNPIPKSPFARENNGLFAVNLNFSG